MRLTLVLKVIGSIAIAIAACGGALAADMPVKAAPLEPAPAIPGWTFSLTPYAWAISLDGPVTVKGRTADVNANFFQILDHTQFPKGLMELAALGEARYDRFAILTDIAYFKLGLGESISRTRAGDAIGGGVGVSAGLTIEMVIAEFAAAYEVARWNGLFSPASTTALDLYAGGRVWWQRGDLDITASGTVNIFDLTFSRVGVLSAEKEVAWVDPLVGARIRHQFAPTWNAVISGDVGGFGAGSKFSWQALALVEHEICRSRAITWSAMLGYKVLSVDYSQGAGLSLYKFDLTMHGPIFGLTARF